MQFSLKSILKYAIFMLKYAIFFIKCAKICKLKVHILHMLFLNLNKNIQA